MIVRVVKRHPPGVKNQKKIVIFDGDHDKFVNSVRTKFGFSSDQSVRFVDNSDGAEVEEDVMAELLTATGGTVELMVLLENEDWEVETANARSAVPASALPSEAPPSSLDDPSVCALRSLAPGASAVSPSALPSSLECPPGSQASDAPAVSASSLTSSMEDSATLIERILQATPAGEAVLSEYKAKNKFRDTTRKILVNLLVHHMMEMHGKTPSSEVKTKYARGVVNLFPSLKDPHTIGGHEAFYDEKRNMGFLVYRIKNLNRGTSRTSKRSANEGATGGPLCKRATQVPDEDLHDKTTDVNWLKHTPAADDPAVMKQIKEKWKTTAALRRQMVDESKTAGKIIMEFPKFLKVPGLVEIDFGLLLPNNTNKFLEQWPSMVKPIVELAREAPAETTASLLKLMDGKLKEIDSEDSDEDQVMESEDELDVKSKSPLADSQGTCMLMYTFHLTQIEPVI
ncbi:uncharacterized protein LOC121406253 [Lytechinus variegatus]|uniref:uncharacterized protein LOC121406253 n=1 Tax=Lytechinus variegatus TaxID=7654 RepID=UPI001BB0ED47|nr:uncharacterized protein LOC121406253 [Lytechinus variegatus]